MKLIVIVTILACTVVALGVHFCGGWAALDCQSYHRVKDCCGERRSESKSDKDRDRRDVADDPDDAPPVKHRPFKANAKLKNKVVIDTEDGGNPVTLPAGTKVKDLGDGKVRVVITTKDGKPVLDKTFELEETALAPSAPAPPPPPGK